MVSELLTRQNQIDRVLVRKWFGTNGTFGDRDQQKPITRCSSFL